MRDQTITLERAVLLALMSYGDPRDGLDVNHLWRRLTTADGAGPSWRSVASTVTRLERQGYLEIVDEAQVGEDCHPLYALTDAGRALARQSQQLRPQGLEEFRRGEHS
ncbi:hypothetical protein [Halomonas getboli]|uniref:hypothetical protein n=1 Tax=Halomonas getboli TaxID=2935862 RepID=UPI001FFEEA8E|nr:hypothetical protein [Halomonas getboli]MCK2183533.1 hypothetical protein [Halomonas getboli]